ncbi:MAG TPA: hypothetical protein VIH76_07285 [Candidatus Acidoferrales bacterium]
MEKSLYNLIEEIFMKNNPPGNISNDSAVKVRYYIQRYINAIKRQEAIVVRLTDAKFIAYMGLSRAEGKAFLDRINLALEKVRPSDIAPDTP